MDQLQWDGMCMTSETNDFASGMMTMMEIITVMCDTADEMRTELRARGYSVEETNRIATEFLCGFMRKAFEPSNGGAE